ncbi:MAG: ABC transporter ATP-binding protein/permease [Erysipelotrichaceae bacterium]|nr:ABC transporter ATP-binding protein/permease [Erysipelotrichaceae bacterium]
MKNNYFVQIIQNSIKKNKSLFVILLCSIVITLVLTLLPPLILEKGINELVQNKEISFYLALMYFMILVFVGISESIRESSITIFGEKVLHELRSEMSKKISRIESSYLINHDSGEIATIFVTDIDTIETLFNEGVISMVIDMCSVISIIIVVFMKSVGLGILLCLASPLLMIFTRITQQRMLKSQIENREAIAKAGEIIPETLKNKRVIHNIDGEIFMENKYDANISKSYKAIQKSNFYDSIYSPVVLVFNAIIIAIVMILSTTNNPFSYLFNMSVGTATALISYVNKVFKPLESIGMEIQNVQTAVAGITRINALFHEREMTQNHTVNHFDKNKLAVSVNNITFGYDKNQAILKDYSLEVKHNETVTITGRTGAGKSTLFKLILGLYPCDKGEVSIFGVPATNINETEKREIYGCVEQEFKPTTGTLKDQITLKNQSITNLEVEKALETVGLKDKIQDYNKPFMESEFSQGQLQLLSIARAIVKNPEILLLDEMTANLDALTEKSIMEAIYKAQVNRTVLSISHRTYTLSDSREVKIS